MWPKALTQLVELAPHITRLAPLADRFLKDKATGDNATRQALDEQRSLLEGHRTILDEQRVAFVGLADRLHGDLGAVAAQQSTQAAQATALEQRLTAIDEQLSSLNRPVADFERHLTTTRADALSAKQATEALEGRLARIEAAQGRTQVLAIVAVALLVAILILIATLFLRARQGV